MATCSVYLYKDTKLKDKKNFSIDYIDDYLSPFLIRVITDYQYQRMNVFKKIKLNSDQINCSVNYLLEDSKPNYLMFLQDTVTSGGIATTSKYYYFIESITQISEKTIELDLKMDVLNTFNYNTKGTNNTNYTLSDRSLILREHKNRWKADIIWQESIPTAEDIERYETIRDYRTNDDSPIATSIQFNLANIKDFMVSNSISDVNFSIIDPITDPLDHPNFFVREYVGQDYFDHDDIVSVYIDLDYILRLRNIENDDIITVDLNDSSLYDTMISIVMPKESTTDFNLISQQGTWYDIFTNFFSSNQVIRASQGYKRIVDQFEEGIETVNFKTSEREVMDESKRDQWYLVYRSSNAVVETTGATQPTYVNPILMQFYSDEGYTYTTRSATLKTIYAYDEQIPQIKNRGELLYIDLQTIPNGAYVRIAGVDYTNAGVTFTEEGISYTWYHLYIRRKNNNDKTFITALVSINRGATTRHNIAYNFPSVSFYGINSCDVYSCLNEFDDLKFEKTLSIGSGEVISTNYSPAFKNLDITDPRLVKIIAFPYCPRSDLEQFSQLGVVSDNLTFNTSDKCFELVNPLVNGFNRNLGTNNPFTVLYYDGNSFGEITPRKQRNIIYESKLFHSDFYKVKFVYDSFSFLFRPEDMDIDKYPIGEYWNIQYACSGNVQSKFLFKFTDYVCKREIQDYNDVLIVERNNEKALFTSAFMNYIKNGGYTYDSKNADMQKMTNGITIALTTIGAITSFVSSIWTGGAGIAGGIGLLVGTAGKTIGAIHQAQQNDRQISQKLLETAQQSTSVSGSEDLDLLMVYSGNKAKYCYYEVSSYMKNALWDLFHYYGYKCQYYGIPNINSRCNFNFVQGEVILKNYTFNDDIASEIVKKWKEGITFFHKRNNTYDIEQEYENFETNLLTEV